MRETSWRILAWTGLLRESSRRETRRWLQIRIRLLHSNWVLTKRHSARRLLARIGITWVPWDRHRLRYRLRLRLVIGISHDLNNRHLSWSCSLPVPCEPPSRIVTLILSALSYAIIVVPYGPNFDLYLLLNCSRVPLVLLNGSCNRYHRHFPRDSGVPVSSPSPSGVMSQPLLCLLLCMIII